MENLDLDEINRKHNISLDASILDKFAPVPSGVPEWKKEIIKKKNEKTLSDAIQEAVARKDPYAGIPQWKRDLLVKRDKDKEDHKRRLSEEKKLKDDVNKKFESKPEWKKDIILKRRLSQDHTSPREMQP